MPTAKKATKKTAATEESHEGFTEAERAAMKDRAQELKASARRGSRASKAAEDEQAVVDKIAEMSQPDRGLAERIHAIVKEHAPGLAPKLWYGMPAYAKDGKVLCFFQGADKFTSRYATFGFNDVAELDDGAMWPTAFAVTELTADVEARIGALVRQAAG